MARRDPVRAGERRVRGRNVTPQHVTVVGVDREGVLVAMHRTRDMPHAFFSGEGQVVARVRM